MSFRPPSLFALALAACAGPLPPPDPAPAAMPQEAAARPERALTATMKQIETHFDLIEEQLVHHPAGNLRAVANAAHDAAELVRRCYGELEDGTVPGFARYAREAETWLLQIGLEARQAHGELAREAFLAGRGHCTACHDAHHRVHG